jgi:Kef-type K+ transport system membrane component KefB
LGRGGFHLLAEEPVIELLGSIGLLYIMFVAGLEIDLTTVRNHKAEAATFGGLGFVLTFPLAAAVGLLAGLEVPGALLLGAALSSHTLVSYPQVNKAGLARYRPIVSVTGGTLLTDTAALILLVLITRLGGDGGWLGALVPLGLLVLLAALALLAIPRFAEALLGSSTYGLPEKALFSLAVLLVLAAVADLIGTEEILGAFLAGLCLNRALEKRENLRQHVEFVGRMLFVPFFYVQTGMQLELEVFAGNSFVWIMGAGLIMAVLVGKSAAAWMTGHRFGYSRADRAAMAGLSYPQAAATLAIVVTGQQMGLMSQEAADAVILVIFVTCLAGPLLVSAAVGRIQDQREARGGKRSRCGQNLGSSPPEKAALQKTLHQYAQVGHREGSCADSSHGVKTTSASAIHRGIMISATGVPRLVDDPT